MFLYVLLVVIAAGIWANFGLEQTRRFERDHDEDELMYLQIALESFSSEAVNSNLEKLGFEYRVSWDPANLSVVIISSDRKCIEIEAYRRGFKKNIFGTWS